MSNPIDISRGIVCMKWQASDERCFDFHISKDIEIEYKVVKEYPKEIYNAADVVLTACYENRDLNDGYLHRLKDNKDFIKAIVDWLNANESKNKEAEREEARCNRLCGFPNYDGGC